MIEVEEHGGILTVRARGRLTREDYDCLVPAVQNALSCGGELRLYLVFEDFQGWEPAALWQDLRFDFRRRSDFHRVAVVGDVLIDKWMSKLARWFFTADVRFFDPQDAAVAANWLRR
ncbi:STAS/SEC14 domain-containing protein [Telmatospirillum sp. J64-1]|uniref:STAS/SEC14 domain-containing protein n=1 Tax=Telmatospirillum sp. J64-1 TaxID=2502183 RepID=UPI00115F3753|nr:STAS/SEC14 domain-containing protein [Telmatospirillum sp. J64-1]